MIASCTVKKLRASNLIMLVVCFFVSAEAQRNKPVDDFAALLGLQLHNENSIEFY